MQALKHLLSTRVASIACILLASLGRIIHVITTFHFQTDKSFQLQAAKNFYLGKGISIYEASPADLSQFTYQPLVKWPPFYSILSAPLNVFGDNFLLPVIIIDVLACLLFIWAARKIFQLMDAAAWQINLYTLVAGFSVYHFAMGASTDLLCLSLFLAGCYFSLRMLKKPATTSTHTIPAIIFFWLAGFTRFLAAPLALLIPAYLYFHSRSRGDRRLAKGYAWIFCSLIFLFVVQFLLQKLLGGVSVYLYPTEKGFFPANLLGTGPFIYEAAGNLEPLALAADRYGLVPFETVQDWIILSHLAILILLGFAAIRWMIRSKFSAKGFTDHFTFLSILLSAGTFAILGYLSLTNGRIGDPRTGWTYVSELRYYAAPIFFIQLVIFSMALKKILNRFSQFVLRLVLAFMILSAIHGFLYIAKLAVSNEIQIPMKAELRELDEGIELLERTRSANADLPVVCLSNDAVFLNYTSIQKQIPGLYPNSKEPYSTSRPVLIFTAVKRTFGTTYLQPEVTSIIVGESPNWKYYYRILEPARKQ